MRQFRSQFLHEPGILLERNPLDDICLDEVQNMVAADSEAQQMQHLAFLDRLRTLVEQHVYEDTSKIFPEWFVKLKGLSRTGLWAWEHVPLQWTGTIRLM